MNLELFCDLAIVTYIIINVTTCLLQWLARLTAVQEVPGSIPGYTLEIFLEVGLQGLELSPPSLVRTFRQLLDVRSSEIRLRKLKIRLTDMRFANYKAPCTVIWHQPLQSVLALRGCSATDLILLMYNICIHFKTNNIIRLAYLTTILEVL